MRRFSFITCLRHSILAQKLTTKLPIAAFSDVLDAVNVEVERAPRNSRRIYAGVDINAPIEKVWGALTDYEHLHHFIPGKSCIKAPKKSTLGFATLPGLNAIFSFC
jgi:hypothetical protein